MSKGANMSTIQTYSGHMINFVEPEHNIIDITDIAHSLSNKCRFNGHTCVFYSVAEHSLHVHDMMNNILPNMEDPYIYDFKKKALMHDFSEAYISDIHTPLKAMLPEYRHIEMKTTYSIDSRFHMRYHPRTDFYVKLADKILLIMENDVFLSGDLSDDVYDYVERKIGSKRFDEIRYNSTIRDKLVNDTVEPMYPNEAKDYLLDYMKWYI